MATSDSQGSNKRRIFLKAYVIEDFSSSGLSQEFLSFLVKSRPVRLLVVDDEVIFGEKIDDRAQLIRFDAGLLLDFF